ncbi:hypothetical protein RCL1_009038 [Eukaryota sp. TZLM3-RCL]
MTDFVQVRFVSDDPSITVPSDSIRVPVSSTPVELSELVNELLSNNTVFTFSFLYNDILVQTALSTFIQQHNLSSEHSLTLHVFIATSTPSPSETLPHDDWVSSLLSIDSSTLISGCYDGSIYFWSNSSLFSTRTIHTAAVTDITAFSDGDILNLVTVSRDGTAYTFTLSDNFSLTQTNTLVGHTDSIETVSISPEGSMVCTGCNDHKIRLFALNDDEKSFDVSERSELVTFANHKGGVTCIDWAEEGSIFSSSLDQSLIVWDVLSAAPAYQSYLSAAVLSIEVNQSNTSLVVSGLTDSTIKINDIRAQESPVKSCFFAPKSSGVVSTVTWSNDTSIASCHTDNTIRIWDLRGSSKVPVHSFNHSKDDSKCRVLCGTVDEGRILTGGTDGKVVVSRF